MLVKEKLIDLFTTINTNNSEAEIFDFVDSTLLDMYYLAMYGNRELASIAEDLEIEFIAKILANMFLHRWNAIVTNYLSSEGLLNEYSEVVTETSNDTLNTDSTRESTTKVSAFNEDIFTPKDSETSTDVMGSINERNKQITTKKIRDSSFYLEVNEYLSKINIYEMMIKDSNEVVLSLIIG